MCCGWGFSLVKSQHFFKTPLWLGYPFLCSIRHSNFLSSLSKYLGISVLICIIFKLFSRSKYIMKVWRVSLKIMSFFGDNIFTNSLQSVTNYVRMCFVCMSTYPCNSLVLLLFSLFYNTNFLSEMCIRDRYKCS